VGRGQGAVRVKRRALALGLSLAALLAALGAGCGRDDATTPTPEAEAPDSRVFDNPDSLMAYFFSAYRSMSLEKYRAALHPGYRFLFRPEDVSLFHLPFTDLLRSEDLGTMANLFSGASGHGYDLLLPVTGVHGYMERQGAWTDTGTGDADFPHTLKAEFDVRITFDHGTAGITNVWGQQTFYLAGRDSVVGGETRTYYRICGQRDLTSVLGKAAELATWGEIKNRYYTGPISPAPPDLFPRSFPANPDTLMARFAAVYLARDTEGYRAILADGFRFVFSAEDVTRLALLTSTLTRAEDLGSTANMFSGNPVPLPGGQVPAVTAIRVVLFERTTAWTAATDPDFPNARQAIYNVELVFERLANATNLIMQGQQHFYAVARDSTCDGITRPCWQLSGQEDLTSIGGKASEQVTWGGVKELYR
jgi:hypothetical protein